MIAAPVFRSDESFTQKAFRRWVEPRPLADVSRSELIDGRIVMTPPAGRAHGSVDAVVARMLGPHVDATKAGEVLGSSLGYNLPSGDEEEAQVLASAPPVTRYWSITVENFWHECIAGRRRRRSPTNAPAATEADGSVRVVVAASNPGSGNCLDGPVAPDVKATGISQEDARAWATTDSTALRSSPTQ